MGTAAAPRTADDMCATGYTVMLAGQKHRRRLETLLILPPHIVLANYEGHVRRSTDRISLESWADLSDSFQFEQLQRHLICVRLQTNDRLPPREPLKCHMESGDVVAPLNQSYVPPVYSMPVLAPVPWPSQPSWNWQRPPGAPDALRRS